MMKQILAASIGFLLTTTLVGCSTKKAYTGPEPAATVDMQFHSFDPVTVAIHKGETVKWNNESLIWHTVTFDPRLAKEESHVALPAGAEPFDSGKLEPGSNFWHTFTVPGVYHYICRPHEHSGMHGTVVVQDNKANAGSE
jgi:plastocyanin